MSPAQAAEARSTRSTGAAAPARARGPQRPRIVPVREADQPQGRIARAAASLNLGSQLGRIGTLAAVALFVSVFGVVIFQTLIVQGQARLDNLNARAAAEEERSRDLHQQVADLEAPARIVETARDRLGMVPSGPVGYLSPSADDAEKSTYVAPPPTTAAPATTPSTTKKKSTTTTTTPTTTAPKKSATTTTPKATTP